jgi:hypothetical protein
LKRAIKPKRKVKSSLANECDGSTFPDFKRNNYFQGKLLSVADFQAEQDYFINKMRLRNRLLFGKGVVCGLEVAKGKGAGVIEVSEGFALDGYGREIILSKKFMCDINQKYTTKQVKRKRRLLVTVSYEETKVDPIPAYEDVGTQFNMILEGAKIELNWISPKPSSKDKVFLATLVVEGDESKISVRKIENSAKVRGATLKRIMISRKRHAK